MARWKAMPRYYFDVWEDETLVRDEDGIEFASLEAAKAEALVALPAIAQGYLPKGGHKYIEIRVMDEAGQALLRVAMALVIENLDQTRVH
jgi:hypothetical protein